MPIVTEIYEIRCHMIERMAVEAAVPSGGDDALQFPQPGRKRSAAAVNRKLSAIVTDTAVADQCHQNAVMVDNQSTSGNKRYPDTVYRSDLIELSHNLSSGQQAASSN